MRNYLFFPFLFVLLSTIDSQSQTVTINGPVSVSPGEQEYYEAVFDYQVNQYSAIGWSVTGGTIIEQQNSPMHPSGVIYCIIEWNSTPVAASISLYEDLGGGNSEISIDIGNYSIIYNLTENTSNRPSISCNSTTPISCNLILNNNFTTLSTYDPGNFDPFTTEYIPNWTSTHGTPMIGDLWFPNLQPPGVSTGFAYMYSNYVSGSGNNSIGEGIAQKIPALSQGSTYQFSFYIRYSEWGSTQAASQVDNFYAVLMNCNDLNSFPSNSSVVPTIPSNAQTIYHETAIVNQEWMHVQITFTALSSYDILWVFPKQTTVGYSGVNFAYPVLVNISDAITISPSGTYTICSFWEGESNPVMLTTNLTSNLQWYRGGNLIPGATSSTYTAYADNGQGNIVKTYSYTVRGTSQGCAYESAPTTINFVPTPYIFSSTNPCRNSPITLYTTDYGAGATYSWSIPGAIISPNANSRQIQITFPGSYTSNSFTATLNVTNSYNCNGSNQQTFGFFTACRNTVNGSLAEIKLFPNPANNSTTISSKESITAIEIISTTDYSTRQVRTNGTNSVTINTSNFRPGLYSCKVVTTSGTEYLKLMIER